MLRFVKEIEKKYEFKEKNERSKISQQCKRAYSYILN